MVGATSRGKRPAAGPRPRRRRVGGQPPGKVGAPLPRLFRGVGAGEGVFSRMPRRHIPYLTWVGAILPGVVALALLLLLWGSTRDRQLPSHGGRAVGRATFDWSDFGGPRIVVWYPGIPMPFDTTTAYVPGLFAADMFHGRGPFSQRIGAVRDQAFSSVVAVAAKSYPVVILSAAAGREPTGYAMLAEELAGRGYVVVGSSPPAPDDSTPAPPRNTTERAADIRDLLDRLQRRRDVGEGLFARIDVQHVAFLGQGVGAEASLAACAADPRCAAAVVLGGNVPSVPAAKPVLAVLGSGAPAGATPPPAGVTVVRVQGLRRIGFTDDAVLFEPWHDVLRFLHLEIGGRRGIEIVSAYTRAFLDRTIRGEATALPSFPEASVSPAR